jgi:hypothetical protein
MIIGVKPKLITELIPAETSIFASNKVKPNEE